MGTFEIDDFKIRELYGLCKSHKIKGFKKKCQNKKYLMR